MLLTKVKQRDNRGTMLFLFLVSNTNYIIINDAIDNREKQRQLEETSTSEQRISLSVVLRTIISKGAGR